MSAASLVAELRERDARAREVAQRCFDRPLMLEAGAGTGKTSILVARIVAWCLGPGWERARRAESPLPQGAPVRPDRIAAETLARVVAITFTEAAAAEMAERVSKALAELEQGRTPRGVHPDALPTEPRERRERARALLGALDHLVVRTIHSWCRRLLVQHPIEAGLHPLLEVDAEGRAQAEVIRSVLEARWAQPDAGPGSAEQLELAVEGYGPRQVEEALAALVAEGVTSAQIALDPLAPERVRVHLEQLADALARFREAEQGKLSGASARARRTHAVCAALEATAARVARAEICGLEALEAFTAAHRENWERATLGRLAEWARGTFGSGERKLLGAACEEVSERAAALLALVRAFVDLRPMRLDRARRALAALLGRVGEELRARGAATFASLLADASRLLRDRPDVCARLRGELDQLLVDEFQDTDPRQCEIVRALALSGPRVDRPGLFVVGDPKQSIYGWRRADLGAYHAFRRELRNEGGEVHLLCVNFRSPAVLLAEVERAIEPVMQYREGMQPEFQRLVPCDALAEAPGFGGGAFAPVEYWVSWSWDTAAQGPAKTTRAAEAVHIEARALARDLRALHDERGVAWKDVGVLFRGTGDLEEYLAALREADVPYAVERDRSYYRRREVIEAAALVRAVLDPNDHLALLTLLRSALAGVPDAALIPLWSGALPQQLTELERTDDAALAAIEQRIRRVAAELPDGVPGIDRVRGWEECAIAVVEALAALRESFVRDPADVFVEKLRRLVLIDCTEAARHVGAFRVANLERFFRELLDELAARGDPELLLRRLRSDVARQPEADGARPRAAVESAVRMMTIHGAKGLAFDHVYLVQLHKRPGGDAVADVDAGEVSGKLELRVFDTASLGFESLRRERERVAAAERVRTLYVAMTRARERLVVLGSWPGDVEPISPERARSHIDLLSSRAPLPEDLSALMKEVARSPASPWRDAAAARWKFPAVEAATAAPRTARARDARAGLPAREDVVAQSNALRAHRERAERRAARPWRGSASATSHALWREESTERRFGHGQPGAADSEPRAPRAPARIREVSAAVGIAVHRALEEFDFEADPQAEIARHREQLSGFVAELGRPERRAEATRRARAVLDRFAAGPLFERFLGLRSEVIARELPIWTPPQPDGEAEPVGCVAGVIDLLYRDSASGAVVVADYKSDEVETDDQIEARCAAYAPQGRVYVGAVQEALGLAVAPRFELWFLHAGVIVRRDVASGAPAGSP